MTPHAMTRFRSIFLILALVALPSCSRGPRAADVIPEERFVMLYADLLVAREERSLDGGSPSDTTAQDSIRVAYGVTAAQAATTLERYRSSLATWKEFHAKVTKRLEMLQQETAAQRTPTEHR